MFGIKFKEFLKNLGIIKLKGLIIFVAKAKARNTLGLGRVYERIFLNNLNIIKKYNAQHRDALNAIRAREPENAAKMMRAHLQTARLSLTLTTDA